MSILQIKTWLGGILNKKFSLRNVLIVVLLMLGMALMGDSCSQASSSQNDAATACSKWGCDPNLSNFYEYQQMIQIYKLRDNPKLILNVYLYSDVTGQLTCFGQAKGFGIPYGTQFSPPTSGGTPVPEPNGLYPSQNTNADWLQHIDPQTGQVSIMLVEPNMIITAEVLPCIPLHS